MFNSIVIEMKAENDGKIILYPGQKIHAVFLKIIKDVNEDMSEKLHNDEIDKAFSVSSFLGCKAYEELEVHKDKKYYIRFTVLQKKLFSMLTMTLFKNKMFSSNIKIEDIEFKILNIIYDNSKSKWAGVFDMDKVLEKEIFENEVGIRFYTPTLFKSGDNFIREPEPKKVFGSLLRKFNKYSYYKIDENIEEEFEKIQIKEKKILIKKINLKKYYISGFMGDVIFNIPDDNEKLKQALYVLAEFSFYSGIGYKTTMGFGQAKKI